MSKVCVGRVMGVLKGGRGGGGEEGGLPRMFGGGGGRGLQNCSLGRRSDIGGYLSPPTFCSGSWNLTPAKCKE